MAFQPVPSKRGRCVLYMSVFGFPPDMVSESEATVYPDPPSADGIVVGQCPAVHQQDKSLDVGFTASRNGLGFLER